MAVLVKKQVVERASCQSLPGLHVEQSRHLSGSRQHVVMLFTVLGVALVLLASSSTLDYFWTAGAGIQFRLLIGLGVIRALICDFGKSDQVHQQISYSLS